MAGDLPLAIAFASIRKSLTSPECPTKEYEKVGNGIYKDEVGTLFFRDLRLVSKRVIVHGNYPFSASKETVAIADTIKKAMPIGNYRQFRLDQDYDSISMGGIEMQQESIEPIEPVSDFVKTIQALAKILEPAFAD